MGGRQATAPPQRFENLSQEARTFLSARGYSQDFIAGLMMMLREAGSVHARSSVTYQQGEQEFMDSPGPPVTVTPQMPDNLQGMVNETTYQGRKVLMPDIGPYAPTTTYHPETYKAFASAEGQRFMARYYERGWVRRDPKTNEWVIRPPVPLSQIVPRRTP
jgi:hypothetical protein